MSRDEADFDNAVSLAVSAAIIITGLLLFAAGYKCAQKDMRTTQAELAGKDSGK